MSDELRPKEPDVETDEAKRETLRQLIDEGINSPRVDAADAFARLRQVVAELALHRDPDSEEENRGLR
jgi:hypothetical protein